MSEGRNKLKNFSLLQSLLDKPYKSEQKTKQAKCRNVLKDKNFTKPNSGKTKSNNVTLIRIPQYGHKIDDKVIDELQNPQSQNGKEILITVDVQKERQKDESKLFKWLCKRFPKCFDPIDKKPLKIGIGNDIETIYQNEHFAAIDRVLLGNVLRRYVSDTSYYKAVFELKQRFNLQGKPVEQYTSEHIEHSRKRLDEIAEKSEFKAKGLTIKQYYQYKNQSLDKDKVTQE